MLTTKNATIKAVKQILRHTGWGQRRLEREAGLSAGCISRLLNKDPIIARAPAPETREKVNAVYESLFAPLTPASGRAAVKALAKVKA